MNAGGQVKRTGQQEKRPQDDVQLFGKALGADALGSSK